MNQLFSKSCKFVIWEYRLKKEVTITSRKKNKKYLRYLYGGYYLGVNEFLFIDSKKKNTSKKACLKKTINRCL